MRLAQIVDENDKRALVVTARGESRLVKGARTTLRPRAAGARRGRAVAQADRRPRRRQAGRSRRGAEGEARADRRSTTTIRRMSMSPAPASPISARPRGATRCTRTSPTRRRSPTRCRCSSWASKAASRRKGETGVQPEWFYKGDGSTLVAPGRRPRQPELRARRRRGAGDRRRLCRSTPTARRSASASRSATNSPTTSPSGRTISISPIRSCGRRASARSCWSATCPPTCSGVSRIRRGKEVVWEKPFLSGEQNMSHTIANLEAHHFKYAPVPPPGRRPRPFLRHGDAVVQRRRSRPRRATCSRSRPSPSACRCATG